MRDDKQWARQIAGGDTAAFTAFVDAYGPRLHRLARRYAATESDAEDITQEIFIALYRGMARFRGEAALSTWAYQIAQNLCRRYAARSPAASVPCGDALLCELVSDAPGPAYEAARSELSKQVHSALDDLSSDHRMVVILHELQELTYAECAAVLQVPVGTVKSRLSYAFRHLRGALREYVQPDPLLESE